MLAVLVLVPLLEFLSARDFTLINVKGGPHGAALKGQGARVQKLAKVCGGRPRSGGVWGGWALPPDTVSYQNVLASSCLSVSPGVDYRYTSKTYRQAIALGSAK